MPVVLMPDAESMVVKFLLDDADISALAGTNVATSLPANPPFPFVVVQLISTTAVGGEANVNEYWVQLDAYAGRKDFSSASALGRTIHAVCFALNQRPVSITNSGETALMYGARIRNYRRFPEPKTEWARYTMDVLFTARQGS